MDAIKNVESRSFQEGVQTGRSFRGTAEACPYDNHLAPNLRVAWLKGFAVGYAELTKKR